MNGSALTTHAAFPGATLGAIFAAVFLAMSLFPPAGFVAHAQQQRSGDGEADLGELYRRARTEALARQAGTERVMPPVPVELRTPALDSMRVRLGLAEPVAEEEEARVPLPRIRVREVVRRLERPVFEERFGDVDWAYLGANGRAVLDTMQTRELRARLQAHYGDPTRAVTDALAEAGGDPLAPSEYIQFAYWFVANDSIPLRIVDTGGPFDRGVVFAAPARFRRQLRELRDAFFAPLLGTGLRARYVDYYLDGDAQVWYRAGFDGRRFFARPVPGGDVVPGQRPALRPRR